MSENDAEKIIDFFGGREQAPNPEAEMQSVAEVEPTMLTAEILASYADAVETEARARIKRSKLRDLILRLAAGHVREGSAARVGEWVAIFSKQERTAVDWKKYVEEMMGQDAIAEAKAKYGEVSETVVLKVQRVGMPKA